VILGARAVKRNWKSVICICRLKKCQRGIGEVNDAGLESARHDHATDPTAIMFGWLDGCFNRFLIRTRATQNSALHRCVLLMRAITCERIHGAIEGRLMATRQQGAKKSVPAADLFADAPVAPDGIRVGIGGWTFAPWRNNFYPTGLVQQCELEFASRHVNSIEINGT